jgi:DNA-binding NarL/FixJ family response regulator
MQPLAHSSVSCLPPIAIATTRSGLRWTHVRRTPPHFQGMCLPASAASRVPDAVITIAPGGGVVDANAGAELLFGVRSAEVVDQPIAKLVEAAGMRAAEVADLGATLCEQPSRLLDREFEVTASRPDGHPFSGELMIVQVGSLFIVWIRDVSARRVTETASAERFAALERAAELARAERRQIVQEIAGHIAIEEVLATWSGMDNGADELLAKLGHAMGFVVGVLWLERCGVLRARASWSAHASERPGLEIAERPLDSGGDQALAVEAWRSRQPLVVVSLPAAPPFPGRDAAVSAGLQGAVALPAVNGDLSLAVLEFYARESLQPTETLLRSLTGMGHELGHFFARRSGELQQHELTRRERQILQLAAQGMSGKTIAQHLSLSPSTVKSHFEHIYTKWDTSDRASAVAKAVREGLIE